MTVETKSSRFNFFLEPELQAQLKEAAAGLGYRSASDYVRHCVRTALERDGFAPAVLKEQPTAAGKNPAAVALGKLGGPARAASLTAKKRKEIAKKAAAARWKR